jgi:argininosuccinate synthase
LAPHLGVIAPWKDPEFNQRFKGRSDLITYAKENGINIPVTLEKPYSTDENLMHKSYESGLLEDPMLRADSGMFTVCVDPKNAPDKETLLEIVFKDGVPVCVKNLTDIHEETDPLKMFVYLNKVAGANGVGRIDIVENRFIGIKSRGVYETPAGTVLHVAHRDIEGVAMDQEVQRLRDMFSPKFAQIIYNGFWFSPEMEFLTAAVKKSQELIDGRVLVSLYKGHAMAVARESPSSLYNRDLSSMDIEGGFTQSDSAGFIRIHALRLKAHGVIVQKRTQR